MGSPLERLIQQGTRPLAQHDVFVGLKRTAEPSIEPVTLDEANLHCKVEPGVTEDNVLILSLIIAARNYVENQLNRSLITQTWELVLDTFPSGNEVALPKGDVQSVTNVTTYDEADASSVFTSSGYRVDTYGDRVTLVDGYSWPSDLRAHNGVIITYVAGYGDEPEDVPNAIRQAILMLVAHWYENREAVATGTINTVIKMGVDAALSGYRRHRI
jgi:uncharacterized phiE125 gp8 family phage protein